MGIIGGEIGYKLLKRIGGRGENDLMDGSAYKDKSKLDVLLGAMLWDAIRDKTVLDFGCGAGEDTVEMAQKGAARVVGLDIQERFLAAGRDAAARAGVSQKCVFVSKWTEPVDVVVTMDGFEHFADPGAVLQSMRGLLKPGGRVIVSFGSTWYHPLGGHLFSVFPWAHLLFTEEALIRWRSEFKTDGATRFSEVAGGLNQMTIRRFERTVAQSPFRFERYELVPIRKVKRFANRLTREFTTSTIRCTLVPKDEPLSATRH
jgi:SAM-dependent methyltransferase